MKQNKAKLLYSIKEATMGNAETVSDKVCYKKFVYNRTNTVSSDQVEALHFQTYF